MLRVHAICYYRSDDSDWPGPWREGELRARELIDALKNEEVLGMYEYRPSRGGMSGISNTAAGREAALLYASQAMLGMMKKAGYAGATLIPIPSTTHTKPAADFVSRRIARAIEKRDASFRTAPVLYFARPLPKASSGGRRTTTAIRVNLRATSLVGLRRVVLVDDITTTGAHLKAAASFLADKGIMVRDAFVVARVALDQPENMFSVPVAGIRL